jgi:serine/threonine protein kinase
VRHANVVPIVDVGVARGVPFLVMELIRGGTLEQQRARFGDLAWAVSVLRQITDGLSALHDAGVLHRDLKPSNVLLAGDAATPTARISDFGISRFDAFRDNESTVSRLTRTGMILGTPLYMAPETGLAPATDASGDVFSLGVVAFELLSGRPPFQRPPMLLALSGELPSPEINRGDLPAALRECVTACLAESPSRRPRLSDVRQALSKVAH